MQFVFWMAANHKIGLWECLTSSQYLFLYNAKISSKHDRAGKFGSVNLDCDIFRNIIADKFQTSKKAKIFLIFADIGVRRYRLLLYVQV